MPPIPTPRQFARLLRRMELPERAHLSDLARKGEVGRDPAEAALVAAAARRELRGRWLIIPLSLVVVGLSIINSVSAGLSGWFIVVQILVVAIGIPVGFLRNRRSLQQAERLNTKRSQGDE
jgi:hypothetical protein